MRNNRWILGVLMAIFLAAGGAATLAADPSLYYIDPPGGQRGKQVTLQLVGARLQGLEEVFFYEPGIKVLKIEADERRPDRTVNVTLQIAPDARLGKYHLRARTRSGWTVMSLFHVGALPDTAEKNPNDSFAQAQPIEVNTTITGTTTSEDEDYYVFEAKKGQRISIDVEAIRLAQYSNNGRVQDGHLVVYDKNGAELKVSDDTALHQQDPHLSLIIPEDGKYFVMLRDAAYYGTSRHVYRMHIGEFPRPTAVYPAGGKAGEPLKVQYLGVPGGIIEEEMTLPDLPNTEYALYATDAGGIAPSPNRIRISDFPNVLEVEPNNSLGSATESPVEGPVAFNGILTEPGDVDYFVFTAKKNQTFDINVYARQLGTPVDPVLVVYDASNNRSVGSSDDNRGNRDSYVRFRAPEDGKYIVRVYDQLSRGGADFVYRVEVAPPQPQVAVRIPDVARRDSRSRQFAAIPQGNRWFSLMRADRDNIGGDLQLIAENLPQGVTMHVPVVASNVSEFPIVFEAAADAPIAGKLADLKVKVVDRDVVGTYYQAADVVRGPQNGTPYITTRVDQFATAVTEAAPFRIRIIEPKAPLARSGSMDLKVAVERDEGFTETVRLEFDFRPAGVSARSSIAVPGNRDTADYPLSANSRAATGEWDIAVLGYASVDGGNLYVSSQLAKLKIVDHLVSGKMKLASVEQGQTTEIEVALEPGEKFEGEAKLELIGLPNKATAEPVMIKHGDEKVVFKVVTDPATPVGNHKSLYCQLTATHEGEPIVQTLAGGGTLRVDRPRAANKADEAAKSKAGGGE